MYLIVTVLQVALFKSKWGLRTRAVGELPVAADSVGIDVNQLRFRNVILAGAVAGIGGAVFTLGAVGIFSQSMTAGAGFIALACLIFGSLIKAPEPVFTSSTNALVPSAIFLLMIEDAISGIACTVPVTSRKA